MEKIIIAGDFVPQDRVLNLIETGDCSNILTEIAEVNEGADYCIVNLEAPIVVGNATPIKKNGPNLKTPLSAVGFLKKSGFNCITLANNHFYDQGEMGAKATIAECSKQGIDYVGAGLNIEEASQTLFKQIKGKKFAFINCCEHEYSIATNISAGSNPINPIQQFYAIQEAKQKADYIIVICHGGIEHFQFPTPRMVEWYRFFIDAGADAVINHHQHCFSGFEVYKGKPIFYGLGNLCFDRITERNSIWNQGYIVELLFDKELTFEIHPYIQCNESPCVKLLIGSNRDAIIKRIESISTSIINGDYLNQYQQYLSRNCNFDWVFTPYTSGFLRRLFSHKLLPKILGIRNWRELRDLQLCESHNERYRHFILSKLNKNE